MGLNARSCPSTVHLPLLDGDHIQASKTRFLRSSTHSSMKQKANKETFVESKIPDEHRGRVFQTMGQPTRMDRRRLMSPGPITQDGAFS